MKVVHVGDVVNRRGDKHSFSLIMYGVCSRNAVYSASLSFRMFIFHLTAFDNSDYYFGYYFGLNISLVLRIKELFIKKYFTFAF